MWEVDYACIYRPVWYPDSEHSHPALATVRAQQVHSLTGRTVRVVDPSGQIILLLSGTQHPGC